MARILVVDDEPDVVSMVARQLRRLEHEMCEAYSATEALESIVAERPSLAVVDVSMPGTDGLELVRILRSNEQTKDLPVVFLSAKVLLEDIEAGISLGAYYLTKPCTGDILRATVSRALATSDD